LVLESLNLLFLVIMTTLFCFDLGYCVLGSVGYTMLSRLNAVFSAVSGLELSMSKEHHRCKFIMTFFCVLSWHVFVHHCSMIKGNLLRLEISLLSINSLFYLRGAYVLVFSSYWCFLILKFGRFVIKVTYGYTCTSKIEIKRMIIT